MNTTQNDNEVTDLETQEAMLAGFDEAPSNRRLPYIRPNEGDTVDTTSTYTFEVVGLKLRSGFGGDNFAVAEFKVLSADGEFTNKVGTLCSDVIKLSGKYAKSGLGSLRDLIGSVKSVNPDKLSRAAVLQAINGEECIGMKVNCAATLVDKQKSDGVFTRKSYSPAAE